VRECSDDVIYDLHSLDFHACGNLPLDFADTQEMSITKVHLRSTRTTLQRVSCVDIFLNPLNKFKGSFVSCAPPFEIKFCLEGSQISPICPPGKSNM